MSPADQHLATQAAVYTPSAAALAKDLPDIGEGLAAQLVDLSRDPTPDRCERMAINLGGAQRAVLRLREVLLQDDAVGKARFLSGSDSGPDDRCPVALQERGHGQ